MTFLQPYLLFALPLIALPILIHLINQNRHKTIHWAATMFLLQAKRMSKGIARLKYLLIMMARMLAIAGLIFAVSRPMAGGWLGFAAGSQPDTTIIVLDRSASMEEQGPGTSLSKRETALRKISELIATTGNDSQIVLFDSATSTEQVIGSPRELLELPSVGATSTTSDLPNLLEGVTEYVINNETGRTDVWICSDLRAKDWNPTGGRWETIRKQLSDREGVRLYLLNYQEVSPSNLSISVSSVHRRDSPDGAELVMDLRLTRNEPTEETENVQVGFVINGSRSVLDVEMTGAEVVRNGHTIPLSGEQKSGWGRVELPSDANPLDNVYRFVYSEPAIQKTVIVSDDNDIADLLRLAASTGADPSLVYEAEIVTAAAAPTLPWDETALILWQAPLPTEGLAEQMKSYLATGRSVIFFPTETPGQEEFLGLSWGDWVKTSSEPFAVQRWRTDAGLLSNTLSGSPLPVGDLEIFGYSSLSDLQGTTLANISDGVPLLQRTNWEQGEAFFCTTLPRPESSNLSRNGIVLYVMIHRALSRGAAVLGAARQVEAGSLSQAVIQNWKPLDDLTEQVLLSQRSLNAGLYRTDDDTLYALNRPLMEDDVSILDNETLELTLNGINFTLISDEAGSEMALASEIWRTFLIFMIAALLLETFLCLPDREGIPQLRNKQTATA